MPLIEGIGDEVVQFVVVVLVLVVAALAWWSTNARPDRYRTVLVMSSRPRHPVTVSIRTSSRSSRNLMLSGTQTNTNIQASTSEIATDVVAPEVVEDHTRVIPLQEMDSIIDADMAMLDNNRLHFYRRIDSPSNPQSGGESTSDESEAQDEASSAQIREMDSIVSAMEAELNQTDLFTRPNESNNCSASAKPTAVKNDDNNEPSTPSTANVEKPAEAIPATDNTETSDVTTDQSEDRRKILIKLKYLNDTLKEVEGSLDELLKDFKWRHFSSELTAECRVRLIFNGRVLLDDAATLRACGLHDRAVVHCLVHPKRLANQQRGSTSEAAGAVGAGVAGGAGGEVSRERAAPERAWDLENILMTLVSVALTVVWFFRCEYSNMFTASASVALFGLTVFYSVAIFGLYLSDTFQFDRRPQQPVPNN